MVASPHHIDLPNYPFIRIILLTAILLNKYFLQKQKEKSFPKFPRQAQCQSPFNANSAQEISAFQRHPYNYPRRVQTPLQHTQMAQNGIIGWD